MSYARSALSTARCSGGSGGGDWSEGRAALIGPQEPNRNGQDRPSAAGLTGKDRMQLSWERSAASCSAPCRGTVRALPGRARVRPGRWSWSGLTGALPCNGRSNCSAWECLPWRPAPTPAPGKCSTTPEVGPGSSCKPGPSSAEFGDACWPQREGTVWILTTLPRKLSTKLLCRVVLRFEVSQQIRSKSALTSAPPVPIVYG